LLLAVPNVSEGRDTGVIAAIGQAFDEAVSGVSLLDTHSDADHDRSVYTLAGAPRAISDAVLSGARATVERVDVLTRPERGRHPHVGALDVAPIVYLDASARGAACAEALVVADRIGCELGVPVFLYGELAGGRARAELRRGGVQGLAARMARASDGAGESRGAPEGSISADFGPRQLHPTAGATLVAPAVG
jgi:glutamate formiminotransferase